LDQAWIHGESLQAYILLFGVINPDKFKDWCKQNNELAYETTLKNENLITEIMADVMRLSKEFGLNGLEKPKGLYLQTEPFSIDNGLLTPTMKLKRNIAKKKFNDEIVLLYEKGPTSYK
jgi:long-chain acyl-CoA synthetase